MQIDAFNEDFSAQVGGMVEGDIEALHGVRVWIGTRRCRVR